jgi:hypothetical protein
MENNTNQTSEAVGEWLGEGLTAQNELFRRVGGLCQEEIDFRILLWSFDFGGSALVWRRENEFELYQKFTDKKCECVNCQGNRMLNTWLHRLEWAGYISVNGINKGLRIIVINERIVLKVDHGNPNV